MITTSFIVKGERGEIVLNLNYNHTLQHYNFTSASTNDKPRPVPLALFNRVYDTDDSAKIAAQQWINNIEITEGRR